MTDDLIPDTVIAPAKFKARQTRRTKTIEQRFHDWWKRNAPSEHYGLTDSEIQVARAYAQRAWFNAWAACRRTPKK